MNDLVEKKISQDKFIEEARKDAQARELIKKIRKALGKSDD